MVDVSWDIESAWMVFVEFRKGQGGEWSCYIGLWDG